MFTHTKQINATCCSVKNNEVSGHRAVYSKYLFLRATNTEEEDVVEVIKIMSWINPSNSIMLELRMG